VKPFREQIYCRDPRARARHKELVACARKRFALERWLPEGDRARKGLLMEREG